MIEQPTESQDAGPSNSLSPRLQNNPNERILKPQQPQQQNYSVRFPFPSSGGILALEISLLVFIAVIEGFRLFFGYKGNLGERKQTLIWSVVLAIPILISQLYLMLWQTYVLRVELVLCAFLFIMVSMEIILSAATIWTFQRHESFISS